MAPTRDSRKTGDRREVKAQTRDTSGHGLSRVRKRAAWQWALQSDLEDLTRFRECVGHTAQD